MLPFSAQQSEILAAPAKKVSWLWELTTPGGVRRWSTKEAVWAGKTYEFRVIPDSFAGVRMQRARPDIGTIPSVEIEFRVSNAGNAIKPADLLWSTLTLRLVVSDYSRDEALMTWRMDVVSAVAGPQELTVRCQDFLAKFLDGDWPTGRLVHELLPTDAPHPAAEICVPELVGEAFLPLRSVYSGGARYYVLGTADKTYTIAEVRSPREAGAKSSWLAADGYEMRQSTLTVDSVDYRVLQPIIADSDGDGTADACGIWRSGETIQDLLCRFSRSDSATLSDPAAAISWYLRRLGVPAYLLDTGASSSFAQCTAVCASRGIIFSGGWATKLPRAAVLANMLAQAALTLDVRDKVYLRPLAVTPVAVIAADDVLANDRRSTYRYQPVLEKGADSGHVQWQQAGEPTDRLISTLLPAKTTTANVASLSLRMGLVHDADHVSRAGRIFLQRRLNGMAMPSWSNKLGGLAMQPDDVVTVDRDDYGGTYDVVIDELTVRREGRIDVKALQFSEDLDDWEDLAAGAVTIAADDSTAVWQPVLAGPDATVSGGTPPNETGGKAVVQTPWAQVVGRPYVTVHPTRGEGEFQTLAAALSALSSTGGAILLRNATYTDVSVTMPAAPIEITGESRGGVVVVSPAATERIFSIPTAGHPVRLSTMTLRTGSTVAAGMVNVSGAVAGGAVGLDNLGLELSHAGAYGVRHNQAPVLVRIADCHFSGPGAYGITAGSASMPAGMALRLLGGSMSGLQTGASVWQCPDAVIDGTTMAAMTGTSLVVVGSGGAVRNCKLSYADQQRGEMRAVLVYGGAAATSIEGNEISLVSNYDPTAAGTSRAAVWFVTAGAQSRVVGNTITMALQAAAGNYDTVRGVIVAGTSSGSGLHVVGNIITMTLGGNNVSGMGIDATVYRSRIAGNNIRQIGQASASLVGINLTGDGNTGGDNTVIGADLALADAGSGNTVTARLL